MRPATALLAAALAAVAAQGCAHRQAADGGRAARRGAPSSVAASDGLTFDARRARLMAVAAWDTEGRLAVDTGERAFQGTFRWQQRGDELELTVRGFPLRTVVLRVSGTPQTLTVTARGADTRVLDDPETQLSELLGWWLPVSSLHAWLLGLPDSQFPATTELGPEGALAGFEQRLWRVDYASYQLSGYQAGTDPLAADRSSAGAPARVSTGASGNGAVLVPRRIDLKHGELGVRLTIDTFKPAEP
jgi:outer membrane lipoprotein LolB